MSKVRVIIELDEDDYKKAKEDKLCCGDCRRVLTAVRDSTPYKVTLRSLKELEKLYSTVNNVFPNWNISNAEFNALNDILTIMQNVIWIERGLKEKNNDDR